MTVLSVDLVRLLGRDVARELAAVDHDAAERVVHILQQHGWHATADCRATGTARYEEGVERGRDDALDGMLADLDAEHTRNPAHWTQPGGADACEVGACAARQMLR